MDNARCSSAFRADTAALAVAAGPGLGARVPCCLDWTVAELGDLDERPAPSPLRTGGR